MQILDKNYTHELFSIIIIINIISIIVIIIQYRLHYNE